MVKIRLIQRGDIQRNFKEFARIGAGRRREPLREQGAFTRRIGLWREVAEWSKARPC